MVRTFEGNNVTEIWKEVADSILKDGEKVKPRDMEVKEILPVIIKLNDINKANNVLNIKSRKLSYDFMLAEMLWILSGSDNDWILRINKGLDNYRVNEKFVGAYGVRIRHRGQIYLDKHFEQRYCLKEVDQLECVVNKLGEDRDSRQCVVMIYDPLVEVLTYHSRDI